MKIAVALPALLLAGAAAAQGRADLPSGSPLGAMPLQGAPDAALVEAQRAQQARMLAFARARAREQQQRAMAEAFAPRPAPPEEDASARTAAAPSFAQRTGQADDAPSRPAPSPYGGYYQIRTPWDR